MMRGNDFENNDFLRLEIRIKKRFRTRVTPPRQPNSDKKGSVPYEDFAIFLFNVSDN